MKANENGADRAVRVILGIVALVVSYTSLGVMDGAILGIVVAAVGVILVLTGLVGFCPAYKLVGLSTCKSGECCGGESCGCSKPE
jgi:Inner membrane protein YgaP-like, transmembrane domain